MVREDQCSRHTTGEVQATNETTTLALNRLEKALRIVKVGVVLWWLGIRLDQVAEHWQLKTNALGSCSTQWLPAFSLSSILPHNIRFMLRQNILSI